MVGDDAENVVDAALEVLHRSEGLDQFLFLHLIDAHWPYLPPEGYIDRFGRPRDISSALKLVASREAPPSAADTEDVIRLYDAEIAYADEHLGRLVADLKSRDLYDDALIIVTADHGEAFYEHGHWEHTVSLYDQVTHIPLIVKWPASSRPNRSGIPASQVDVFPTLLEAAGIEPPETGAISLSRQLSSPDERRGVMSELTSPLGRLQGCEDPPLEKGECLAVRLETLKYIASFAEKDGEISKVSQQLYDVGSDPLERQELSGERPAEAEQMLARVQAFLRAARNQQRTAEEVILDDETTKALESLGYIQ
jgi:arylsulfatase A-like enzyme